MILLYLFIGAVMMFAAGELYAKYRVSGDRRDFWFAAAGALLGVFNLISAIGVV
jgi:uncharacterized protein YqgC (DUF456 family)